LETSRSLGFKISRDFLESFLTIRTRDSSAELIKVNGFLTPNPVER
jgi:hypothetical protein